MALDWLKRFGMRAAPKFDTGEAVKTLLQVLAIAGAVVIYSMIIHKGYADLSALAEKHSGAGFWRALGQYFFGNLAGGGKPPSGR